MVCVCVFAPTTSGSREPIYGIVGTKQFAPSYKVEKRWSDRIKQIDQFLFPGYIFCRFDPNDRLPILTAPGVVDVVGFGKLPEHVP